MPNLELEKEIIKHICYNFGIKSQLLSIVDNQWLVHELHLFEDSSYKNRIYGLKINVLNQNFIINFVDVSDNKDYESFILFINAENLANYALYVNIETDEYLMFIKTQIWERCSTYLQSTFLSGMEQVREIGFYPEKITFNTSLLNEIKLILEKTNG